MFHQLDCTSKPPADLVEGKFGYSWPAGEPQDLHFPNSSGWLWRCLCMDHSWRSKQPIWPAVYRLPILQDSYECGPTQTWEDGGVGGWGLQLDCEFLKRELCRWQCFVRRWAWVLFTSPQGWDDPGVPTVREKSTGFGVGLSGATVPVPMPPTCNRDQIPSIPQACIQYTYKQHKCYSSVLSWVGIITGSTGLLAPVDSDTKAGGKQRLRRPPE